MRSLEYNATVTRNMAEDRKLVHISMWLWLISYLTSCMCDISKGTDIVLSWASSRCEAGALKFECK